jgi:hypothetical protein
METRKRKTFKLLENDLSRQETSYILGLVFNCADPPTFDPIYIFYDAYTRILLLA